jgi:signal transduction histidine kinase
MPLAGEAGLANLFDLLEPHDPSLRALAAASPDEGGSICERRVVRVETPVPGRIGDQHLAFTLLRLDAETLMAVFEDVTRMVKAEAEAIDLLTATAIERGRSELAAEVLHDIGNAVVGIGTRTASLLEDSQWPELQQLSKLGTFLSSREAAMAAALGAKKTEALLRLIGELFASLEQRRQRVEQAMRTFTASVHHIQEILNLHRHYARQSAHAGRERIALKAIVQDALTIQAASLEKRQITVETRFANDQIKLSLDRTRMIQVLVNLLKNVCEAFDLCESKPGRSLVVELTRSADGSEVRLVLRDNACGFAPARSETFFNKHSSTKGRGSGIGLYHCRKVVESHGGSLILKSDGLGLGASAILSVPTTPTLEPDHAHRLEHACPGD